MPDLPVLLAILVGLTVHQASTVDPVFTVLGTLAASCVAAALTWMSGARAIRAAREGRPADVVRAAQWVNVWPLVGWVAAATYFEWGPFVANTVPRELWLGQYVVLFLPAAFLFGVGWVQRGRIDAIVASGRGAVLPVPSAWDAFRAGLRRNGIALLPMAFIIGLLEGVWLLGELGVPGLRTFSLWMEGMPLFQLLVLLGVLSLLMLALPAVLRRVLSTEALPPGPVRSLLERQAAALGLRYRDILLWKTRGMALNAMVVGFTPRTRLVFLTDALLRHLPEEEVLAVFSHEAGHARRHHLPLFLVLFVTTAVLFAVAGEVLQTVGVDPVWMVAAHLAFLWFVLFGAVSRVFEREADLFGAENAARLDPGAAPVPVPGLPAPLPPGTAFMVRALERVRRLSGRGSSHRHGTIQERVNFLAAQAVQPGVLSGFQRRVRRLHVAIAAGAVCAVGLAVWRLPADVTLGRSWVAFQDANVAYEEALASREAGREDAARPRWQAAYDGFADAAARLEGRPEPRAVLYRHLALFNAADSAFHGLGDEAAGLEGFRATLADAETSGLEPDTTRFLRFQSWVDAGRILAHQGSVEAWKARREARELFPALGGASPEDRGYFRDRLNLLDGVVLVGAEHVARAIAATDPTGLAYGFLRRRFEPRWSPGGELLSRLALRTHEGERWDELRRDARLELHRARLLPTSP